MKPLHIGQIVRVETVDGGRLPTSTNNGRPLQTSLWAGRVLGPSVLGDELWLIKSTNGTTYTVPRREISGVSRLFVRAIGTRKKPAWVRPWTFDDDHRFKLSPALEKAGYVVTVDRLLREGRYQEIQDRRDRGELPRTRKPPP